MTEHTFNLISEDMRGEDSSLFLCVLVQKIQLRLSVYSDFSSGFLLELWKWTLFTLTVQIVSLLCQLKMSSSVHKLAFIFIFYFFNAY